MSDFIESTVNAEPGSPVVEGAEPAAEPNPEGGAETQPAPQEPAAPARQSRSENAAFAAARREAEAQARAAQAQAQQLETQNRRLMEALGQYGYQADDPLALADQLEAQARQMTVDQVRAERARREQELQAALEGSPQMRQLKAEGEALRQQLAQRQFADDLAAIKKYNKDEKARDITDLGVTFLQARAMGMDTLAAYDLVVKERERSAPPKPPEIGRVASAAGAEPEFYTSEELDRLTSQDLDDPVKLKRAMASLPRLKK